MPSSFQQNLSPHHALSGISMPRRPESCIGPAPNHASRVPIRKPYELVEPPRPQGAERIAAVSCSEAALQAHRLTHDNRPTMHAILLGKTKSPVASDDLRAFLGQGEVRTRELAALEFLLAFHTYKAAFFDLTPSEQAPRPSTVMEHLSLLQFDRSSPPGLGGSEDTPPPPVPAKDKPPSPVIFNHELSRSRTLLRLPVAARFDRRHEHSSGLVPSNIFFTNPTGRQAISRPPPSLRSTLHSPAVSTGSCFSMLDPALQPLRREMQAIVDSHLSGTSSRLLMTLVRSEIISTALSETELTTHPDTLEPLATLLTAHLDSRVSPAFFEQAVANLTRTTKIGRLVVGVVWSFVALALTGLFVMDRRHPSYTHVFPRAARLALAPIVGIAIACMIESRTGVCLVLVWKGLRETQHHEEDGDGEMQERARGTTPTKHSTIPRVVTSLVEGLNPRSSAEADTATPRSRVYSLYTLNSEYFVFADRGNDPERTSSNSLANVSLDMDEKGGAGMPSRRRSPNGSLSSSLDVAARKGSAFQGGTGDMSFLPSADEVEAQDGPRRFRPSLSRGWRTLLRLTGLPVGMVPVDDRSVRRVQRKMAILTTSWLAFGVLFVMTVIMLLP